MYHPDSRYYPVSRSTSTSRARADRVEGIMPHAARYCTTLRSTSSAHVPADGLRCVSRVYTEIEIFDIDSAAGDVHVLETFGIGVAALSGRMEIELLTR